MKGNRTMRTLNQLKNTHQYKMVLELFEKGECRPVIQYGTGRRTSYKDYTDEVLEIINKDFVVIGNDAPRGGVMGKYIRLILK